MAKKKLEDLTEKERKRLGILTPQEKKHREQFCSCKIPSFQIHVNEMSESWEMCKKCNKEIL